MRINKYLSQNFGVSRRKADELVADGKVKVNGVTIIELGCRVAENDVVEVDGTRVRENSKKIYILLNKPIGYVTTMKDEHSRPTVAELVADVGERIFPVGRLDYNTSGLLLMTNDGDMAYRLTHPKHEITKTYRAKVSGYLSDTKLAKLRRGVDIGGFVTSRAAVKVIKQMKNSTVVEIEIHEGKNRQVRKMFKAVGCPVQELQRIDIGGIKLGRLMEGHYRRLKPVEMDILKKW